MLEFISGLCGLFSGICITLIAEKWMYRNSDNKLLSMNEDLLKYLMVKQDAGAFTAAFPKPDVDKLKQEEENKNRKEILEFNAIQLRDSVNYGLTDDEIRRFGFDKEGINA